MKIDVTSLVKQKGSKLECKGTEDFHFEEAELQGPLDFDVTLTNIGREILARATLKGNALALAKQSRCQKNSGPLWMNG